MKKFKHKIFGVLITMLLGATATFGQTFYYDENQGGVVIDCTMMPEGTVLTNTMATGDDYQLPSNYDENDSANTVYPLLVLAMDDLKYSNNSKFMYQSNEYIGFTAVLLANRYEVGDLADWRLPNQRELMMIWVLYEEIEKYMESLDVGFVPFQDDYYWSSTIYSKIDNYRCCVDFSNGRSSGSNADLDKEHFNDTRFLRCARVVREIRHFPTAE